MLILSQPCMWDFEFDRSSPRWPVEGERYRVTLGKFTECEGEKGSGSLEDCSGCLWRLRVVVVQTEDVDV